MRGVCDNAERTQHDHGLYIAWWHTYVRPMISLFRLKLIALVARLHD